VHPLAACALDQEIQRTKNMGGPGFAVSSGESWAAFVVLGNQPATTIRTARY